ncbi:ribosome maturation factor RimM [SAR86 cluster bacterium]|jgi:16S rRNA processing protein RimM|nr:ribosome maturation factor RimM [SAR86 cluster bacterium]|tara:strand:+ start:81 stop:584 length:504 start_codon:yes stop_codon:yes gene_type:complete
MSNQDDKFILVGSIGKPIGLKGLAKVNSFTRPPENLFLYKNFYIESKGIKEYIKINQFSKSGKSSTIKISSVNTIEEIELFKNKNIFIKSSELPILENNQFYWKDLIGKKVKKTDDVLIGTVTEIMETGSNDVLVVTMGKKSELIPFIFKDVIKEVDDEFIIVEWEI